MHDMVIYDQPLNEMMRVCLRLEQLFQQIDHQINDESMLGTRNVVSFIISILHILDRPDLKTKLAKELSLFLNSLLRYSNDPNIDNKKLSGYTSQIESYYKNLISSSGKIGSRLREIELLNTLRLHLASPGSGCSFDIPLYHYWLQQPPAKRKAIMHEWLGDFNEIREIVTLVLKLVRNNVRQEQKTAIHGFYQELLDPQLNLRMLRIEVNKDVEAFPEISVGRHFLSVRFYIPDISKRPTQYMGNVEFSIVYCNS